MPQGLTPEERQHFLRSSGLSGGAVSGAAQPQTGQFQGVPQQIPQPSGFSDRLTQVVEEFSQEAAGLSEAERSHFLTPSSEPDPEISLDPLTRTPRYMSGGKIDFDDLSSRYQRLGQRFIVEPTVEQFKQGRELFRGGFGEGQISGPAGGAPTVAKMMLGTAGMLGSPLAPALNPLANVARTAISGIEAAAAPLFGLGAGSESVQRAAFNIDKIFNVSGEDRPTTGSMLGDIVADVLSGFIPVEKLIFILAQVAKAGTKAAAIKIVSEEVSHQASNIVKKSLENVPEPSHINPLADIPLGGGRGVFRPGEIVSGVRADRGLLTPTQSGLNIAPETRTSRLLPPSRFAEVPEARGVPPDVPLGESELLTNVELAARQLEQQEMFPTVSQQVFGIPTEYPVLPGGVSASRVASQNIPTVQTAGGLGRPPIQTVTPTPVGAGPPYSFKSIAKGKEILSDLSENIRSGSKKLDKDYTDSMFDGKRQADALKNDPVRVQNVEQTVAEQSTVRDAVLTTDAEIPLELGSLHVQSLKKQQRLVDFDNNELDQVIKKIFGPNRENPRTEEEYQLLMKTLKSFGKESSGPFPTFDPTDINPARLDLSDPLFITPGLSVSLNVLRRQGAAGKQMSLLFDQINNVPEIRAGNLIADMKNATKGMNSLEKNAVRKVLDFGDAPTSERVAIAAAFIRTQLKSLAEEASLLGVEVFHKVGNRTLFKARDDYFPRAPDVKKIIRYLKEVNKHLVDTGQAVDLGEAATLTKGYVNRHSIKRYGSVENARELDLPEKFYNTDLEQGLSLYYTRTTRRFEEIKLFGQDNQKANAMYALIEDQGGDSQVARSLLEQFTGRNAVTRSRERYSRVFRTLNVPLLTLAQAINLSQSASTALRTSTLGTARALAAMVRPSTRAASKELALRAGTTLDSVIGEIARDIGGGNLSGKYLKLIGFQATERFNRVVAATAGRNYAESLAKKLLKNSQSKGTRLELTRLGINPEDVLRNKGLQESDIFKAAQQVVNDSQFRTRLTDLPLWWSSPEGRVLTQFKNFVAGQTRLVKNETIRQLKQNPKRAMENFAKLGILFPAVGHVFGEGRQLIRDTGREVLFGEKPRKGDRINEALIDALTVANKSLDRPLSRSGIKFLAGYIDDASNVGAMGVFFDAWASARFGHKGIVGFLAGPSAGVATGTVELLFTGDTKKLKKEVFRRVPFIAPFIPTSGTKTGGIKPVGKIGRIN